MSNETEDIFQMPEDSSVPEWLDGATIRWVDGKPHVEITGNDRKALEAFVASSREVTDHRDDFGTAAISTVEAKEVWGNTARVEGTMYVCRESVWK